MVFNEYELSRVSLRKGVIALSWAVSEMGGGKVKAQPSAVSEGGGGQKG